MICKKCGINNSSDCKYCFSCGARLRRRPVAGVIIGASLGAAVLFGIQIFAAHFVIDRFLFSSTSEETPSSKIPNRYPGINYYGDDTYDQYDWWGDSDKDNKK